MPSLARFGPYEAVAEVRRTALHRVYLAREVDRPESGKIVLKVLDPAVPLPRRDLAKHAAEQLARATLQRELAEASSAWAAVLHIEAGGDAKPATASMETILSDTPPTSSPSPPADPFATPADTAGGGVGGGEGGGGGHRPFVAMEFAGEPATASASRGVRWSAAALWNLADSVVAALKTLDSHPHHPGRGHGRLTADNVLVRADGAGSKGLARARVVLTDPMTPGEAASAAATGRDLHAADARALGRLIYELVEGRPPTNAEAHEGLPATPAWQALGRGGRWWLAACTLLLDAGSAGAWTVEDTRAAVSPARPGLLSRLRSS